MQRSLARENYRETFKKTGYSLAFFWCRVTCDVLRVFLEFYWGWKVNSPSVFRKRWCNVEFFSLSPFRKINGERGFLCRDFAPVAIYGNWPDELKLRSSDATWSVWPWITNPNPDPSKGTHLKIIATNRLYHQLLCLEAWHTNPAHALLNRDDGGLLPDAYFHLIRKKAAN